MNYLSQENNMSEFLSQTDSISSKAFNQRLSESRAAAIYRKVITEVPVPLI